MHRISRRACFALPALAVMPSPAALAAHRATALSLNEDPNHFFASRAGRRIAREELTAWVDQYAGTQVRELLLCVCAQRTAFASKVWTPFWKDYDPKGPDDQPLFRSTPPESRTTARAWIHTAWQMQQDNLDHFAIWTARAREKGLSPWLSVRMNDLHNVEDEQHYLHSDFWRKTPQFRRVPYRNAMRDKALDYGHKEVRDYAFALIDELAERYDFDGLELDWMRHGFHFAPGAEAAGAKLLTSFMRRVRERLGPLKRIAVRVPSRPDTALRLGMDAVAWAHDGSVDLVTPTNYWRTVDTTMPIALWRRILPERVLLGAGLELGLNPHLGSVTSEGKPFGYNTLETVRGAAAAYLNQGADRIYLFNYMDSQTAIEDLNEYQPLLRQCGRLDSLAGKPRRQILTYCDTWAPGETPAYPLPARIQPGDYRTFRLACGPADADLAPRVRLGFEGKTHDCTVRLNGAPTAPIGLEQPSKPWPAAPVHAYAADKQAVSAGECIIDVSAASNPLQIEWVELAWL